MRSLLLAALIGAAVQPATAWAAPGCRGTISGSVKGKFSCSVRVTVEGQSSYLAIEPTGPVEGVPAFWPGSFQLAGALAARSYRLEDMEAARASVAAEGGTLYTATKTMSQRGEATLRLTRVPRGAKTGAVVHGSYRARLVPAGAGKSGEVVVEARF